MQPKLDFSLAAVSSSGPRGMRLQVYGTMLGKLLKFSKFCYYVLAKKPLETVLGMVAQTCNPSSIREADTRELKILVSLSYRKGKEMFFISNIYNKQRIQSEYGGEWITTTKKQT